MTLNLTQVIITFDESDASLDLRLDVTKEVEPKKLILKYVTEEDVIDDSDMKTTLEPKRMRRYNIALMPSKGKKSKSKAIKSKERK